MRSKYYAPEVVQTSGMDCGPAVLASLLQGFGVNASYPKLRDICHTNVDGTSIDDLELVSKRMGLDATQAMVPADQFLLPKANLLPAIVVTQLPGGYTHFVLAWRRHGSRIQIMDPAVGRRWVSEQSFLKSLYIHEHLVSQSAWQQWACSEANLSLLQSRLRELVGVQSASRLIKDAMQAGDWHAIAKLDAATRMAKSLCESGIRRGAEISAILGSILSDNKQAPKIPLAFWSARLPAGKGTLDPSVENSLVMRGAVLIRCGGKIKANQSAQSDWCNADGYEAPDNLLAKPSNPFHDLWQLVPQLRFYSLVLLTVALSIAALMTIGETVLFRAIIDAGRQLSLPEHRLFAVAVVLLFSASILAMEKTTTNWLLGIGRLLECSLRVQLLRKIPRLSRNYLSTRPVSDTADRIHAIAEVRSLPLLLGAVIRSIAMLCLTAGAISWIDPASAPIAVSAATIAVIVPMLAYKKLRELDLCVRTHRGALSLYYYDALLGLSAIRAHHADRAVRREHDSLLLEWIRSSRRFLFASVLADSLQSLIAFGLAAWLMFLHGGHFAAAGSALLVAYWALTLPALGEQLMSLVKEMPGQRSILLRLLEPLKAPEEELVSSAIESVTTQDDATTPAGVHLTFSGVSVTVSGHKLLTNCNLEIPGGCHVGIVGVSGAGKSTLLGLLLGWHSAAEGSIRVDNRILSADHLDWLHQVTSWVDPATQIWNRTLAKNLTYGSEIAAASQIGNVLEPAELTDVLERLPLGLQTSLGESGCLLSGGEGQRVRFARAAMHKRSRLAILDEPFRGLDRETRRRLLNEARNFWKDATLLCVTHDIGETTKFDRVLVIENGKIVEFGVPEQLLHQADSRYRQLLEAESRTNEQLWQGLTWTHYLLHQGKLKRVERSGATELPGSRSVLQKRSDFRESFTRFTSGGLN